MISAYLQGGLGNYMFQIAAAEALALDLGTEAAFNFDTASQVHTNIKKYQDNIFIKVKHTTTVTVHTNYYETDFGYNELKKQDGQMLIGYFQSEKYFKEYRNHICDLFCIPNPEIMAIYDQYGSLYDKKTCSLHVRRGDYIKLSQHHPPLGPDYYNSAMTFIDSDNYLVFSDDIEWCKSNIIGENITYITNTHDYMDLIMMSLCDNNIIANSSFSWWGAWLNKNVNKKVIAPKRWFGPAKHNINTNDIIPDKWMII
jgi:hypothetical protein